MTPLPISQSPAIFVPITKHAVVAHYGIVADMSTFQQEVMLPMTVQPSYACHG